MSCATFSRPYFIMEILPLPSARPAPLPRPHGRLATVKISCIEVVAQHSPIVAPMIASLSDAPPCYCPPFPTIIMPLVVLVRMGAPLFSEFKLWTSRLLEMLEIMWRIDWEVIWCSIIGVWKRISRDMAGRRGGGRRTQRCRMPCRWAGHSCYGSMRAPLPSAPHRRPRIPRPACIATLHCLLSAYVQFTIL